MISNFDVVKQNFTMYQNQFSLHYDDDTDLFGSLQDSTNSDTVGKNLTEAIHSIFQHHGRGILITAGNPFGLMHHDEKYYFTDSHSCGPKGSPAKVNGKACIIQCDTEKELLRICRRSVGSKNEQYSIHYVQVHCKNSIVTGPAEPDSQNLLVDRQAEIAEPHTHIPMVSEQADIGQPERQMINDESSTMPPPIQTSMMMSIDYSEPCLEDVLEIRNENTVINRKTTDNIVNTTYELKSEELAWYHLFPYGNNGLKEKNRKVKITPLDYFQARLLGSDTRFQRIEYFFYALSIFENERVKATISTCLKTVRGQGGDKVEDFHLYLKNMRGTQSYWKTALNDLIVQIRCLGPPTFFLTFSCNDLHWLDMRRALLIADGKSSQDPSRLTVYETQLLVEKFPLVISRHFMRRVAALMTFLYKSSLFGGKVVDHWWRIEFQKRGSPHLHMVVWIEDFPSFASEEGLRRLDEICSCKLPDDDPDLLQLIQQCQIHHHTNTCYKTKNSSVCRFSFPRKKCTSTILVTHSSDDFIRNGGRICILQRREEESMVNNYNPTLLKLWKGNLDIQPCGTNEAIAYYIAKYISKSEPTDLDKNIAEAIRNIRKDKETDITKKLFKICMRILQQRQISACECVFRLSHLQLRDSSRKTIFLNTRCPEQRYRVVQFDAMGRATGLYSNIFDRYEKRPLQHRDYNFTTMSLMEFATLFETHYPKKRSDIEEEDFGDILPQPTSEAKQTLITLIDGSKMSIRKTPAVVRVPFFVSSTDPNNFYYSLLLQYLPYRAESELLMGFDSPRAAFLAAEDQLKENCAYMNKYRERDKQLELAFNQAHAFEIFEDPPIADDAAFVEEEEDYSAQEMTNEDFNRSCQAMNLDQKALFHHVTEAIQKQMDGSNEDRLRMFITGGAGTGKTFTFKILRER